MGSVPGLGRSPGEGSDNSSSLLRKSHGQRRSLSGGLQSLVGNHKWGHRRAEQDLVTREQNAWRRELYSIPYSNMWIRKESEKEQIYFYV